MKEGMKFGCMPSVLDGSESIFTEVKTMEMPEEYSYKDYLSPVQNQGETNMCVTYSISVHLNWNKNVDTDGNNHRDNHVNLNQIYAVRTEPGDNGMTFKEALDFLKHKGTKSDKGILKIEKYSMVKSEYALKQALILNGPCIAGLPVYSGNTKFWDKSHFEKMYGGHAVAIVGYNKEGFIIRNSWGVEYGNRGYAILPYKDFNNIFECWTIID